ncbi:MAG TPA: DUF5666 domain-containing protein [Anaerolineaceae bacterium]
MKKITAFILMIVMCTLALTTLEVNASSELEGGPKKTPFPKITQPILKVTPRKPEDKGKLPEKGKPDDKGKPMDQARKFLNYKGTVANVSATSLTIMTRESNVTFLVNADTRLMIPGLKNVKITDLKIGVQVTVQAFKDQAGKLIARQVMLIPGKPTPVHHVGTVSAYTPNTSISIIAQDGKTYTFTLDANTKILPADRKDQLKAGMRVTIIFSRSLDGGTKPARGIVIHPEGSGPKPSPSPTTKS